VAATKPANIHGALTAATCALLGSVAVAPVQAQEDPNWDFDTALLFYGEDNDRVQDLSLSLLARRNFLDDRTLTLGITADALTGASPNGALPQSFPQTFTAPSGNKAYTANADELPIDATFRDTRVALTVNWEQPLGRLYKANIGASFSKEYDYLHTGLNAKLSRDFNDRNTTLSGGLAIARDQIDPVGGVPIGLTLMPNVSEREDEDDDAGGSGRGGDETKDLFDIVFGVTQVISRNLLVQVNYAYSDSSGYLSDPYKILTVIDGITGDAVPLAPTPGVDGPGHVYLYEQRPADRVKQSLYTQAKYFMNDKVLDISYRYMTDDWQIDSHTVDLRYRWPIGSGYVEPHLRFYTQSAADFYRLSLVDGDPLPAFASADPRLGEFDAITVGAKYGWKTRHGNDMNIRLELYQQFSSISGDQLIGNQSNQDNVPDLNAIIVQFGYLFGM
jgi:opacity protein-like surface antigen